MCLGRDQIGTNMKVFHCSHCEHLVFFESSQCLNCGHILAFLPDLRIMGSLEEAEDGLWISIVSGSPRYYRLCENYIVQNVCNWAIPKDETPTLCQSCRLTRTTPDLTRPGFKEAWYKLEVAKRRLVYTLLRLNCFVKSKEEDSRGFICDFLGDPDSPDAVPVLSGHANGTITINIAEADDAERERRRLLLHEPYRTLLGHFRHESGHYYWDLLVRNDDSLDAFRNLFGDERLDYEKALQDYYNQGPPSDWQQNFVTPYSSSHPWEDWAETWAHYLHIVDTLETASECGLALFPRRSDEPAMQASFEPMRDEVPFQQLIDRWFPLTYLLNNLNRGLGLIDGYPFVLEPRAIEKLRFVHGIIRSAKPIQDQTSSNQGALNL
jgi:hypothetical protein